MKGHNGALLISLKLRAKYFKLVDSMRLSRIIYGSKLYQAVIAFLDDKMSME
jgi:hypothetical protein